MRVLHVPFGFFPSPAGGTEVYVLALAQELKSLGIDSVVAAPGVDIDTYEWAGTQVCRFVGSASLTPSARYGQGDPVAAQQFGRILDEVLPDIVHFHALTASASVLAMAEARKRNIPLVFTYHTPTVSCLRGSMMKWGQQPCDGRMRARTCTACSLQGKGMSKAAASALSLLPARLLSLLGRVLPPGALATALQMPALVRLRHAATRQALRWCGVVVSVCTWVSAVLEANGVPADKICLSRQGVARAIMRDAAVMVAPPIRQFSLARPLRLAYFGRVDSNKGIHVLATALALDITLPVALDIFGIRQGGEDDYWQRLAEQASADGRLRLCEPVAADAVGGVMAKYDLVVIPSVWLETGPLVVYEATAAGVPVLASRLGGMAEIVEHDVTGWLVPAGNPVAWLAALRAIIVDPSRLARWRQQLQPPRNMHDAAIDMAGVYQRQLAAHMQRSVPA